MTGSSNYTEFNFLPEIMNNVMLKIYIDKTNSIQQEVTMINTVELRCNAVGFARSDAVSKCFVSLQERLEAADQRIPEGLILAVTRPCAALFSVFADTCQMGGEIRQENTLDMITTIEDDFSFSLEILQDMTNEFDVDFDITTDAIADIWDSVLGSENENITTIKPTVTNAITMDITIEIMNEIHTSIQMRNRLFAEYVSIEVGGVIEQSNVADLITAILSEHQMVFRAKQSTDTALKYSYTSYQSGFADYFNAIGDAFKSALLGWIIPILGIIAVFVVFIVILRKSQGGSGSEPAPANGKSGSTTGPTAGSTSAPSPPQPTAPPVPAT